MHSVVSIAGLYSIPMSQYVNLNSVDKHRFTSRPFLQQTAGYQLQIYIKLQHFMNMSSTAFQKVSNLDALFGILYK